MRKLSGIGKKIFALDKFTSRAYFYFLAALYFIGENLGYQIDPRIPGFFWTGGILILSLALVLGLHGLALYLFRKSPYARLLDLVAPGLFIYALSQWLFAVQDDGFLSDPLVYGLVALVFFIQLFFLRCLDTKMARAWKVFLLILALVLQAGLMGFLFYPGFMSPERKDLVLGKDAIHAPKAREYTYGAKSPRVNLSKYVYYDGWNKKIRDWYWGYSLARAPLAGKVYLPENKEAPVLFFVHGNHRMTEQSHLGYDYLGRYLAQHGIATVSVDENALNGFLDKGVGNENDARAVLLLENVLYLFKENKNPQSVFYQAFKEDDLYLGGHSRGGEAAHLAADFSKQEVYPDNGQIDLSYPVSVKGVITLSPTSAQYTPAGHFPSIEDYNYLTIHGSHDSDVTDFMGDDGYNHNQLKDPDKKKMAIYVAYMNHARSNRNWQRDQVLPDGFFYNEKDLLPRSYQEALVAKAILGFLQDSIQGARTFYDQPRDQLPQAIYYIKKEEGGEETLIHFEDDHHLLTNNLGGRNQVQGAQSFKEVELNHTGGGSYVDKHGLEVNFNSKASYEMTFPDKDLSGLKSLNLDLMNLSENPLEVQVEVKDGNGKSLVLGPKQSLQGQTPVALTKFQYFTGDYEDKSGFESLSFPIPHGAGSLDLTHLQSIQVTFSSPLGGQVLMAEIRSDRNE